MKRNGIPGPWDCVTAMKSAETTFYVRDRKRADQEPIDTVHRLTRMGCSENDIAAALNVHPRQVARWKLRPESQPTPLPPPPSEQRAVECEQLARFALHLSHRIREEDPALVNAALWRLSRTRLQELVLVLAAAVPVGWTMNQLLGWVEQIGAAA